MTFDSLVVGGGLAGLLASYRLALKGERVCLLERSGSLGGLLRSVHHKVGDQEHQFDLGTHYLLMTGDRAIDDKLLSFVDPSAWRWFDNSLPEGHFFGGKLDTTTGCINAASLDVDDWQRVFLEFFLAHGDDGSARNLAELLEADFGPTAVERLYRPIVNKFTGLGPEALSCDAWNAFGPSRIKLFDDERAMWLKRVPSFDRRLGFAHRNEGKSHVRKGYPKSGGIGQWIDGLVGRLRETGVEIRTGVDLKAVKASGGRIASVSIERRGRSEELRCGRVVFTVPPASICQLLGIPVAGGAPEFRTLLIEHFLVTRRTPIEDLHWITVYEPKFRSFRVTLYDNMNIVTGGQDGRISVEVIVGEGDNEATKELRSSLESELRTIGALGRDSEIVASWSDVVPRAFPVSRTGVREAVALQASAIRNAVSNVSLVAGAAGTAFGQIAAIKSVYDEL